MTHSHPSATPAPLGRTDASRPPRAHHGGHREPYPNAPTPTASFRHSTPRAGTRRRVRTGSIAPIPATVWTCGPTPIDPDAPWPTPILTKIVTSFSKPGHRVALMPWPITTPRPQPTSAGTGESADPAPTAAPDDHLATALAAIDDLDRTTTVIHIQPDPTDSGPASRPFWADLLPTLPDARPPGTDSLPGGASGAATIRLDAATAETDLIIASLRPEDSGERSSDHVALLAARQLRVGGILVLLTHSDWASGELLDPTGPVVASAQNADLLYLQHIIALHVPIHRGHLLPHSHGTSAPPRNRAPQPDEPAPHHRISSDVLVFAQPHDHEPSPLPPTTVPAPGTRS
ncbi:MAG TPA: hypothetical protein VFW21_02875 [Mycobacterium sp.]|nr:hypothetical protein [Mycobacterium sp.]